MTADVAEAWREWLRDALREAHGQLRRAEARVALHGRGTADRRAASREARQRARTMLTLRVMLDDVSMRLP